MKNIAIVANTSFNIVNFRLPLMKFLKEKGYHVVAIAPPDDSSSAITNNGFKLIPLNQLSRKGTNPIQDLKLTIELRNIYLKEKIDVALQYTIKPNIYGSLATIGLKTKAICTVTGLGYTFLNVSVASSLSKLLYKIAFHFAPQILFQNKDDANLFIEKKLVDKNKIDIVQGSGIDVNYFNPNFCSQTKAKPQDNLKFLFIGRLLKDKGIIEYLEAASIILKKHPTISFHIAGDIDQNNPSGIQSTDLDKYKHHDNIIFEGFVEDTRVLICQSSCIVLPSYREGLPRVLLEAMAMQKPSITTNAAGCRDAVDQHCALFCEVADTTSLVQALEKFITLSDEEKLEMGKNARNRAVTIFSSDKIANFYLSKILNLFNKH